MGTEMKVGVCEPGRGELRVVAESPSAGCRGTWPVPRPARLPRSDRNPTLGHENNHRDY